MTNLPDYFLNAKPEQMILRLLAKTHVATGKQLQRLLALAHPDAPAEEEEHNNFVFRLLKLDLLAVKTFRVKTGGGRVRTRAACPSVPVEVYFLTEMGAACAENCFEGISRFAQWGEPEGVSELRIYHNLLVTAALIYTCGVYNVVDFINENQLKSDIYHARSFAKSVAENTGDFRIIYNQTGELESFDGEIILQSKKEQLIGKPPGLVYFTDCRQTADVIEKYKNTEAIILDNPVEEAVKNECKINGSFTNLELKIIELFKILPVALDASTAAGLLKNHRAKVSAALAGLVRKDVLRYEYFQHNLGRPVKFYAPKSVRNFQLLSTRKQFYFLNLLLKLVVKTDSEIESFSVETNCLIVRNFAGKRMKLVIDNALESVNFNIKNFEQFNYLDVKDFVSVKFVPSSFDRLKVAEEVLDKKSLVKMFTS